MIKVEFSPIGIIHTPFKTVENMPIQPTADKESEGWIEIFDEFSDGLADLSGFSHIYLIFHLHKSAGYKLKVIPFLDTVERGIFATRSPSRPNPVGLSVVKIMSVNGNIINIKGLDILDGSPLIDIKPFVPMFEDVKDVRTGWFDGKDGVVPGRLSDGRFKG
jgi:tRNA-Thr(GGU) m(6)t(6)A37 methyltransferase TsaA